MSRSLSRFSGWRSRSLSLGEGLTDSTGARDGTRADGVLDGGRRRLFSFWRFAWRRRPSVGWLNVELSLPSFSGWRSRSLSLGEGLTDSTGARDGTRADGVLDRGRRRKFSFLRFGAAAPSSYRAVRGRHLALSTFGGVGQCRALSPDFPAGARGLYPLARG